MTDVHQAEEPLAGLRPPDHHPAQEGTLPVPNTIVKTAKEPWLARGQGTS